MNKIHCKVWSPARNQFVVASEIAACPRGGAPGQGGRRALLRSRSPAVFAALVASGWLGWASLAQAQAVDCSVAPYNVYNSTASCMGFQSAASGTGATALGSLAHANVLGALAVGYNSLSTGQNGIAMGFQAYTNSINAIYLGARSAAGTGATAGGAIGIGTDVTASGANALAMGSLSVSASTNSVAFANSSSVDANSVNSIAIGYVTKVVNSNNAVALGSGSLVSGGTHGTAVGWQAYASALNAVYLGARTAGTGASAESAVGIGTDVSASGIYSIGMGLGANASAADAIAIGRASKAQAASTIAFGDSSTVAAAAGTGSMAGGHNSQVTGGTGAVALGEGQVANGNGAVAIGDPNVSFGTGAVTMGANNTAAGNAGGTVAANGAVAIGNSNSAIGQGSIALGNASTAAAAGGIALGDTANAVLGNGVAIGTNSKANNANDVALGAGSTTAAPHTGVTAQFGGTAAGIANVANGVVSVGAAGTERQIQNVAAGVISASSTDAINGSQLNTVVTGINNLGTTTASTLGGGAAYDPATGNVAGFSQPINSVSATGAVTGPTAQTTVAGALTALNTNVDNTANIAVKYDAVGGSKITLGATGGAGAGAPVTITNLAPAALNATSTDAVNGSQLYALTSGKTGPFVSDNSVTAVQPVSSGANASAGGFGATATGAASTVLGNQATDNGNANATVLGQGASIAAGITGSNVALGQGSTVAAAAVPTTGATIGGTAYTFAGGAPAGVVSMGSAGNDRQITNVAAGQLSGTSTDAVNGSQLFATNQQVTANSTAITNINNGGGIKYFHANSTLADSNAVGTDSIAVGPVANAYGNSSIAQGLNAVAGVSGTPATANDIALGNAAKATGGNSIAQGTGATANSAGAIAIGQTARATGGKAVSIGVGNTASGDGAVAIGDPNSAIGTGAIAMGANNTSNGQGAVALGNSNTATGQGSVALGNASNAAAAGAVALGDTAVANNTNDVALGSHSITAAPHTGTTAQFGGTAAGVEAAASTNGVVSVGAVGTERQIQNVAAGVISATSTDAINGSQLNSVVTGVNNLGTTTASTLGGGAAYDPATGNVAGFSQPINSVSATGAVTGPTAQTTVAGALTALNTNVDNTANIAVKYDAVGGSKITLGATGGAGAGAPVTITNLAPAALNATSTDAVNGSQLYALTSGKTGPFVSDNSVTAVQPVSSGANASAGGFGATATGAASTVLGNQATDNGNANATVLGQGASIAAGTTGSNVALGQGSTVAAAAVPTTGATIGGTAYTFAGGAPAGVVSMGSAGNDRQITNVAAGQLSGTSTDAVNGSQLFATNQQVTANSTAITNINNGGGIKYFHANSTLADSNAVGTDSIAVGPVANAYGNSSIAQGLNAVAGVSGTPATANDIALGNAAKATGGNSIAQGTGATANSAGAIAIGQTARATGGKAVSIGVGNTASGDGAVAIGDPNSAIGTGAIAMGANNTSNGQGAVALGNSNTATGQGSVALGNASNAAAAGAVALGDTAVANNTNDVALGSHSITAAPHTGTTAQFGGTAAGVEAAASTNGVVSVGAVGTERQIQNVAAGVISATSTDAINGSQLNSVVTGVNNLGTTTASTLGGGAAYDPATGNVAGFSQPINSVSATGAVTGPTAQTTVAGALTALNTNVDNTANIAVKYDAVGGSKITLGATGGAGAGAPVTITNLAPAALNATSTDAVNGSQLYALTSGKTGPFVSDNSVTAVQPVSSGANASAGGFGATATGAASTVLGNQATDNGNANATVLGQGASIAAGTTGSNVALGQGSTVAAAAVPTTGATIGGTAYTFAGGAPTGVVSVGSAGNERQITNVAAGQLSGASTDAVNGSQLFATNTQVTANTTAITNINNGGGIKYFHANSTLADSAANGTDSVAIGPVSTAGTTNAVSIGNGATAGANAGDVALGAGSTTAVAVGTPSTTIAGTTYNFVGTTPTSTVSVGAAGAERTITNVAAGRISGSSTDAINGSQLFATNQAVDNLSSTVTANATHYYSVNDNGTHGGNYTNNGATGINALAAGVGAVASADNSTSLGQNTNVSILGGVALGSGAVSDRAIAPSSGSILVGTNVIPYNTTDRNLRGAVSVGNAIDFRQITNVADGTTDQDAVTLRQLKGAMSSFSVTPIKYFHANSTASDSAAIGAESVAIGPKTTVNGDNGIGMGNGAIVQQTAPGGTAIGQNATVNLADGVAFGTNATSNGIQAMALGAGTQAAFAGSVALGAGSKTDAAVGTASTIIAGTTYNFAGTTPGSTVSVGVTGAERTITNVAAGQLNANSTDAVNGSQLNATNLAIAASKSHYYSVNDGGTQGGNYNNNGATGVDALAAGVGSSAAAANDVAIGNLAAASGGSSIAIGDGAQASGANSISIGTGNVVSGASSVAIGDPTTITGTGSFSVGNNNNIASNNTFVFGSNVTVPAGLDGSVVLGSGSAAAAANPVSSATINGTTYGGFAGTTPTSTVSVGAAGAERQITNVAAGQVTASSTDAINGSQLYSVANGLGTAINNLTTVVNANQFPIASSEGKAFTGSIGAAGSNSLGMGTNAVATGQNSTAAGQGSVASQANTTALGQGAQATAANSTALGQGAVASTGNSVAIGSASATTAAVATAGTTILGTSYSFAGGAPVGTVSVGSAGNERQIQNVAAGQLSATSTDAINGSQLYATNSAINNLTNVVASTQTKYYSVNSSGGGNVNNDGATGTDAIASGKNTTASGTNSVAMGAGASATANNGVAIGAGSTADRAGLGGAKESFSNTVVASTQGAVSVGSAGNERQITNVAGGIQATDAVNVRQLQAVQSGGVHYDTNTDGSTNYSSVTMGNGASSPVAIHNVEAGTAATDAVNVSQLNTGLSGAVQQANQYTNGLAMQLQNNINDVAKKAYAGVAAAMSMESAPYMAGKITYSAGYGYYQNQNAIGVSLRRTADNGRWSLSGGVSGTTSGGVAARLAVSGVLN